MLERLLDFKYEEDALDASDAIAIAVCHSFQLSSPLANVSGAKGKGWGAFLANNPDKLITR
jgi:crossover junction endodeoxyribonuclease RuvC